MVCFTYTEDEITSSSSPFPFALRCFRGFSAVILAVLFIYYLVDYNEYYFVYFTYWGVAMTLIFFLLSILSYFIPRLDKSIKIGFHIIWGANWVITLVFWIYIFPNETGVRTNLLVSNFLNHSLPLILTIIEYILNRIIFMRKFYIFPMGVFTIYACFVLAPYTVNQSVVYAGITFLNGITYILFVAIVLVYVIFLEIARLIKTRTCKSSISIIYY